MTREAFGRAVVQMQPSLYRVSYGILLNHTDCADAVQAVSYTHLDVYKRQPSISQSSPSSPKRQIILVLVSTFCRSNH